MRPIVSSAIPSVRHSTSTTHSTRRTSTWQRTGLGWWLALGCVTSLHAQTWPTQPLTLVIGFSKNSTSDVVAQALAEPLAAALGQAVHIDSVVGQSGTLAAAKVAAATDGHTFGVLVNNTVTVAKMVNPNLSYDPAKDLKPVAFLTDDATVLVAPRSETSPDAKTFLLVARNAGTNWKYGSQGVGSNAHLSMEYLAFKANLHPQHVPLTGGPEVVKAMQAGELQMAFLPATLGKRHSTPEGGLKIVATASRKRDPQFPHVPTLQESGVLGFDYSVWTVAAVPSHWPAAQIDRLGDAIRKVLADDKIKQQLAKNGITIAENTSLSEAKRQIGYETNMLGGIVMMRSLAPSSNK